MYTAKQAGKNRFAVFEPTMHAAIVARHAMSTELSHAVVDGEIDVYYQPILSLATGRDLRRRGPRPLAPPDPRASSSPTSSSRWPRRAAPSSRSAARVLFEACREAAPWRGGTGEGISLTVNLSAAQLGQETFVDDLVDILRSTGLPGRRASSSR